jgi:hypothetical protein
MYSKLRVSLLALFVVFMQACGGNSGSGGGTDANNDSRAGLDFPGSEGTVETMRFRFRDPLPLYPATYIWRVYPRYQPSFFTAFFWANDDGDGDIETFLWDGGTADSYYGAHPYPDQNDDGIHKWEIAIAQADYRETPVVFERWYTQALRVRATPDGKVHEYYWDLPRTDADHRVTHTTDASYGETPPPAPALTWGDAPWNPGKEVWNGIITGIRVYSTWLTLDEIRAESEAPLSTAAGADNIWYLNMSPTPDDIADRSGRGNDPEWVGGERPSLWVP